MHKPLRFNPFPLAARRRQSRSGGLRIVLPVLGAFLLITFLHVWLNIGFDKFRRAADENTYASYKVGFLPVT